MHPVRQPPLLHCFRAALSSRHPLCLLFLAPRPSQSSPRASISAPWPRLKPLGRTRTYSVATKVAEEPAAEWSGGGGDGDGNGSYFFAGEGVSWKSLGISDHLSHVLAKASLLRPSLVQAACIPHILTGKDVIIAAETGSGKTHGYLVPLIEKLCRNLDPNKGTDVSKGNPEKHKKTYLVLCPNVMLCEQVADMANNLLDDSGESLVKVAAVCGRRVFDEADMLLCGSFQNQVIRLINMLRFEEKLVSKMQDTAKESVIDEDNKCNMELKSDDDNYKQLLNNDEEDGDNCIDDEGLESESEELNTSVKDWKRVRKIYTRSKQYVFVAATLPSSGKRTAGGVLKRMFPDAICVSGSFLHRHNPRLEQRWIEVTPDTQVDALLDAVNYGYRCKAPDSQVDASRTMVFANTVDAVQSVAKILERVGLVCILYHREGSLEERTSNLNRFRKNGGIFVCTDAASRGLDIPNVSHVIQAEFATSAVDFLHRVGRTARAGQFGTVTSLYTRSNQDLVCAVRQAERTGEPVENAFSRKRSFRNKLKKRGRNTSEGASLASV